MLKPVPLMGNCLIKTEHLWMSGERCERKYIIGGSHPPPYHFFCNSEQDAMPGSGR
jgi:hypothetical protein